MAISDGDKFTFDAATKGLFELEQLLAGFGIRIKPGSAFEAAGFSAMRIAAQQLDGTIDPRVQVAQMVGVAELSHQICKNAADPQFKVLVPHLRLLSKSLGIQVGPSSALDDGANKLFELLVACWLLPFGTDLDLEDPDVSANGTNPDILVTVEGVRLGVACKVLHSRNPAQWYANVEKAVSQLEASKAERGLVVINMRNHLAADDYWPLLDPDPPDNPELACFADPETPFELLRAQLTDIAGEATRTVGADALRVLLTKPRIMPSVAMWGHTVSSVLVDGQPLLTSVRSLLASMAPDIPPADLTAWDRAVLEALNLNAMSNP